MKISELWLRERIDLKGSLLETVDQLTQAGIEVDLESNDSEAKILNLKVPANRGDCLSLEGILRELAALNNLSFKGIEVDSCLAKVSETFPVKVEREEVCPRYAGRVIQNVRAHAVTPVWMQNRLREAGIRCISSVVDITNYVMLELGQPLHAFDLAKLDQAIQVRYAIQGERLHSLEGQEITLTPDTLIIADNRKPLAIAGIVGGQYSSVTETTQNIFLEAAYFDPVQIRSTAKKLNIRTESSHRFERGVDPQLQARAIERATQLVLMVAGGNPGPIIEFVNTNHLPKSPTLFLRLSKIKEALGICLEEEVQAILIRLGMKVETSSLGWKVTPPSFRLDITREIDLIEEVARIYGYDRIPQSSPAVFFNFPKMPETEIAVRRFEMALIDRGYDEAITYSFISPEFNQLLGDSQSSLRLKNPISEDLAVMRSSLWPGLLKAVQYNQRRQYSRLRLFETGLCFTKHSNSLEQKEYLAGVVTGLLYPEQWGIKSLLVDFYDVKSDVEALLALTGHSLCFEPAAHDMLHAKQTARIVWDQQTIGWVGALHPECLQALELQGPVFLFELDLGPLTHKKMPHFQELSKYPSIRRDIALLVDKSVLAEQLKSAIVNCAGHLIREVFVFDLYEGKGIEAGRKSIALGLVLQHPSRTLVEAEVNELIQHVVVDLNKKFQATLRE